MPELSVADNADGTGATATVAGTGGGTTTVYVQRVDGEVGVGAWAAAGSRVGDGAVALALAKGYYFAHALTAPAALSGLAYAAVTDGLDAVLDRCVAACRARLHLLALPCTARVYDHAWAADPNVQYPATVLTTEDAAQTDEAALNNRDDWGHPVRLLVRDRVVRWDEAARTRFRLWRQAITRAFQNQRLPGVPESVRCKVEPGVLFRRPPGEGLANVAESELTVRCVTRELRGLGA